MTTRMKNECPHLWEGAEYGTECCALCGVTVKLPKKRHLWLVPAVLLIGCGSGFSTSAREGADSGSDAGGAVEVGTGGARVLLHGTGGEQSTGGRLGLGSGGSTATGGSPVREADSGAEADSAAGTGGTTGTGGSGTGGLASTGGTVGTGTGGASNDGGACLTDLSGVGTGDFRISFMLTTTTALSDVALLEQRIGCAPFSMLWSVSLNDSGRLAAGTDDGVTAHWAITTANSVADGRPHEIIFARTSGNIWISRDGIIDSIQVANPYSLGTFPPLQIGTTDCTNYRSAAMAGAVISNVCIIRG